MTLLKCTLYTKKKEKYEWLDMYMIYIRVGNLDERGKGNLHGYFSGFGLDDRVLCSLIYLDK